MARLKVGDKVIKNPRGWIPSEFDGWGAGRGVGRITRVDEEIVDVVWPAGRAGQLESEVMPAPSAARFVVPKSMVERYASK